MDVLRIASAGSVDDGKSTLIGRLLLDSKSILTDQLKGVEELSQRRGSEFTDLALLTDGLRAEREQGITIDVAYRYFRTPARKFIIADTPGHAQYTRNMVTGASTADLAIILVDARKGLLEQSRRHATIASLLRVKHFVLAVNKMDLVDWSQEVFENIRREFSEFAAKLNISDLVVIPMSALNGDNVVTKSEHTPWYGGNSLLGHLETVYTSSDRNLQDLRFPVQLVIRPQSSDFADYRGYAGRIVSGSVSVGDEVYVQPSGFKTRVTHIDAGPDALEQAFAPMSVTIRLEDDLDVSRGDMISRVGNHATPMQDISATVCWLDPEPLRAGAKLLMLHTTNQVRVIVNELSYELDVNTLHRKAPVTELEMNMMGRIHMRATSPILADSYAANRETGAFILIDSATNRTVGAGTILDAESAR